MNQYRKNLLKIHSPSMGHIVIQPYEAEISEVQDTKLVLFPYRLSGKLVDIAAEWAATTQCPIFCHEQDIPTLEKEGFGAYRFHKLGGYKHIDFQGGSIELFPAKGSPKKGFLNGLHEVIDSFRTSKHIFSYHALLRPVGEQSVLLLSSPYIETLEWPVLMRSKPDLIVLSSEFPADEWQRLRERFGLKLNFSSDHRVLETKKDEVAPKEKVTWKVKAV